jgi:hypothetical protein
MVERISKIGLSDTVSRVVRILSGEYSPVSSWDIVGEVIRQHGEYARGQAGKLFVRPDSGREVDTRSVTEWVTRALELLDDRRVNVLHGRLLILCLAALDPALRSDLSRTGLLLLVTDEIKEPLDQLFLGGVAKLLQRSVTPESAAEDPRESQGKPEGTSQPDPAPLHLDSPTVEDRLGRRPFARALARRLRRIRGAQVTATGKGSFIVHLHGPWGAGKSSLLRLLASELSSSRSGEPWVVVDFNAWLHQRLNPPWWPLLDATFRQASSQTFRRSWWRGARLWVREYLWRLFIARSDLTLLTLSAVAIGLGVALLVNPSITARAFGDSTLQGVLATAGAAVALISAVVTAIGFLSGSLLPGSMRAAQSFLASAADPLARISTHFRDLVGWIRRPVAIFIDDLDRCNGEYVVQLLEGIQTIFDDSRVVYVIAADRRWLRASFEGAYGPFSGAIVEPGRSLGALFLEKAFELSISVPLISNEQRADYWRYLVTSNAKTPGDEPELTPSLLQAFKQARSERELLELARAESSDPNVARAAREAVVERLFGADFEAGTTAFLESFAPLLEPNPRAMKRLVNSYAVQRDLAVLFGSPLLENLERRRQLALWTIICMRWPVIEDYLLDQLVGRGDTPSELVADLLRQPQVLDVIEGKGIGTKLDLASIGEFLGRSRIVAVERAS